MSRRRTSTWPKTGIASSAPTTQVGTSCASARIAASTKPAAPEAPQPVAVPVELLGALAALREDQHELALVVEQAMDVRRMRGDPADLRDQHREARKALEEVLDGQVQRPWVRVLLADRLGDHRGVRRQRAGVVGDQQRAAFSGNVLDPLDLDPEPVAIEELDQGSVHEPLDPLRAAPVVEHALRLDRGQQVAHLLRRALAREACAALVRRGVGRPVGSAARLPSARHSVLLTRVIILPWLES